MVSLDHSRFLILDDKVPIDDLDLNWPDVIIGLIYEYAKLVLRLDELTKFQFDRVEEIEMDMICLFFRLGEEDRGQSSSLFSCFADLKYRFRIWPSEQTQLH